jgi:hypothetical protein
MYVCMYLCRETSTRRYAVQTKMNLRAIPKLMRGCVFCLHGPYHSKHTYYARRQHDMISRSDLCTVQKLLSEKLQEFCQIHHFVDRRWRWRIVIEFALQICTQICHGPVNFRQVYLLPTVGECLESHL